MQVKFRADLTISAYWRGRALVQTSTKCHLINDTKWQPPKCFSMLKTFIALFMQCHSETLVFNVKALFLNSTSKN